MDLEQLSSKVGAKQMFNISFVHAISITVTQKAAQTSTLQALILEEAPELAKSR